MKQNPIPLLILCLALVFLLLFPVTPYGRDLVGTLFPTGNRGEEELLPSPATQETEPPSSDTDPVESSPVPFSPSPAPIMITELRDELPGHYILAYLRTAEDEFSGELLAQLHQIGIPLEMLLYPDGIGVFGVFDQAAALSYDADRMQITMGSQSLPFFYLNGILRVQDGENYLCFEKLT